MYIKNLKNLFFRMNIKKFKKLFRNFALVEIQGYFLETFFLIFKKVSEVLL